MAISKKHTKLQLAAATFGFGLLVLMSGAGLSQDKDEKAKKEAPAVAKEKADVAADEPKPANRSLVKAGYTRPGAPEDRVNKKGKIIPAAHDPERDPSEPVIGGTVYFAVFRLNEGDDEIEKSLASVPGAFVKGRNFENSYSPEFDRKAKYLYVYQIVNDRGLDPTKDKVIFAADADLDVSTITDFALRITVDPRYITSWGHFKDLSFSAAVPTRDRTGEHVPASDGSKILPVAFSADSSVLAEIPEKKYQNGAPAHKLGDLIRDFGIRSSNLNLDKMPGVAELMKKKVTGVALANWEGNQLQAAAGGREPDYVQLILDNERETEQPTLDGKFLGNVIFRTDFKRKNALGVGEHSVVFGFTSDLPPKDEPIRIEGFMPRELKEKGKPAAFDRDMVDVSTDGVSFVAQIESFVQAGEAVGTGNATAVGTAPTPQGGAGCRAGGSGNAFLRRPGRRGRHGWSWRRRWAGPSDRRLRCGSGSGDRRRLGRRQRRRRGSRRHRRRAA